MNNFSATTITKAAALVDDGNVTEDQDFPVWWVQGAHGLYRVHTDGLTYADCTCAHGLHAPVNKTRCAHVAAVLISLLNPAPSLVGLNVKGLVP